MNAKLAEMMPMTESPSDMIELDATSLTVGAQYRVRVTPGENWYAYPFWESRPIAATGQAGEAAESEFVVEADTHENVLWMDALTGPTVEPDISTAVHLAASIFSRNQ